MTRYALLDFDGLPIRWLTYPALGTVQIKPKKLTFDDLLAEVGECLF